MVQKMHNNPPRTVADMNTPAWRRAEIPAGNADTNARALARVYGALACGGELDGIRVLSPESIERARTEQANGPDAVLFGWPTRFGLGFVDPDAQVGFGYVMSQMQAGIPPDPRVLRMIDALYASL
jgi:hypothetical protein